ncbi:unnamed protein product [Aphanomyces euteiches]
MVAGGTTKSDKSEANESRLQFTPSASSFSSEHLPGAPILPDCVRWSADCKLACVTDESVMISTFLNKDLSRYLLHPPFLTRYFLPLPTKDKDFLIPPPPENVDSASGSMTYRILHEMTRSNSSNPREISLAKGDAGMTFAAAVWGPRGSAPRSSCAILTLTSNSHIVLYHPSVLDFNWKEVAVLSKSLKKYVSGNDWSHLEASQDPFFATPPSLKKQKTQDDQACSPQSVTFVNQSDLISVTSVAWSSASYDVDTSTTSSLLAFCGRTITTVWRYHHDNHRMEEDPIAMAHTGPHGWPTCSTWMHMETSDLALGTSSGNVLLLSLQGSELSIQRVLTTPHFQPVYSLQYTLHDISVASGTHISIWNTSSEELDKEPRFWQAHNSNITCLELNHMDDTIFSSSTDGCVKCWNKSGVEVTMKNLPRNNYPIFGLSMSPNCIQLAVGYVCPPAAKPSRITQADTTYARLSSGLECFAAPNAQNAKSLAVSVESQSSLDSIGDILAYCHLENSAFQAKQSEMSLLHVDPLPESKPLYAEFCAILESKYAALQSQEQWNMPLYLQVAYQVCTNVAASSNFEILSRLRQLIICYWCENTLEQILDQDNHKDTALSALLMADYLLLSASTNPTKWRLTKLSERLVEHAYQKFGNSEDMARLKSNQQLPPAREQCGLCSSPVPLTDKIMEPTCKNGHALERCFMTLRVIDAAGVVWKCMVCEALANVTANTNQLVCRLCGCFCQKIEY